MAYEIRPLEADDSLDELTEFLHRAYAPLAERGMRFFASFQSPEATKERCESGETYVAISGDGVLVGTILFRPPNLTKGCEWYDRPEVAMFGQFAVEPGLQGTGIGRSLIAFAEGRAREAGAQELALDTALPAAELIEYYARCGYRLVGEAQWQGANYRSLIMSKKL